MVEGARLESVFRGNSNVGSNPTLSASLDVSETGHTSLARCRRIIQKRMITVPLGTYASRLIYRLLVRGAPRRISYSTAI